MTLTQAAAAPEVTMRALPSFQEVFGLHARYIYRALRYLGVHEADLDDVCQEVFLIVHRRLPDFEGRSSIRTWVYGIALRVASDYRKSAFVSRRRSGDNLPEPTSTGEVERVDARRQLVQALEALDDDKRNVLLLYEIEGFTMPEIADMLECPVQTAYTRLHAAREIVGRELRRAQLGRTP